ncbi:MAG: DUF3618 domain-containing protein [Nocardioides sp.]|uniref:DUF3618 domain-containing protein n=1 Tax=Nocardioides sp. TaxID=35761 RepID=UPI003F045081
MTQDQSQLEREVEEARVRLAATIDQLAYRAHPKTIVNREVDQVKAYFVDPATGAPRTDNILRVAGGVVGVLVTLAVIRKIVR